MYISKLTLQNFRSYLKSEFNFSKNTTVVVGPNTAGKTNILEAIFLLSAGKSFRGDKDSEMIKYEAELARVQGEIFDESNEKKKLEVLITNGLVSGEAVQKKKYLVNGVPKRQLDFAGIIRSVLFSPTDLELITNSPSLRRKYLDFVLLQVDRDYRRAILIYEKGLRQRNKLLERIRDEGIPRSQLSFWNDLLIKNGRYISQKREEYINFINYEINISRIFADTRMADFNLVYDLSEISEERLQKYSHEEVASATTLVGPHRDDWKINKYQGEENAVDVSLFGSRGEQRMAILWLKMSELEYINQKTGTRPVLLLDDIFSELDDVHRRLIMEIVPKQQTIITTTDIDHIDKEYQDKVTVVSLKY